MPLTKEEQGILSSIVVASENDPLHPEFPPHDPKFPATPTHRLEVPGFKNIWIKDESVNPTGTHKDRMAWEIVVTYRDILRAKERGQVSGPLPSMSIISSGSAALAIQNALREYRLPPVKVLMDKRVARSVVEGLKAVGCQVYLADLAQKALPWKEILALTENEYGFDITSNEALDPTLRFYDWMSYEILNSSPEYCFIPFGTGTLYENILNINKREVSTNHHDPRFRGEVETLRRCHFLGATVNRPDSSADKLYSAHLPFVHFDEQWIHLYRQSGFCGELSNVLAVEERFLDEAMAIAGMNQVTCEPSGIVGLALMLQMKDLLPRDRKMLIVNTGKVKLAAQA